MAPGIEPQPETEPMRALAWALLCSASQAAECSEGDEEESVCMLQLRSSVRADHAIASNQFLSFTFLKRSRLRRAERFCARLG